LSVLFNFFAHSQSARGAGKKGFLDRRFFQDGDLRVQNAARAGRPGQNPKPSVDGPIEELNEETQKGI
jgi:hypothetical protein